MERHYVTARLGGDEINRAYPLVRAVLPDFSMERWESYVATLGVSGVSGVNGGESRHPGGIMTVRNEDGYFYGLFCYQIDDDPLHGRIMRVETFVALEFLDGKGAAGALLDAMENIAEGEDCTNIRACLHEPAVLGDAHQSRVMRAFANHGFAAESLHMNKSLETVASVVSL
ncbi:MAG: hypothetical protein ACTSRY_01520 [Alphaproteobacteria bacterium]